MSGTHVATGKAPQRASTRRPTAARPRLARHAVMVVLVGLAVSLSACSSSDLPGGGSIKLSALGAGAQSTEGTPTINGSAPSGQYAFVYGNQIWLKNAHDAAPHQLTHLALLSTAYYAWGPLAWSPDGNAIAFVLVEDNSGSGQQRSVGPLFFVNTSNGDVEATAGTASVHGHAYAWFGDNALFYANGTGITFYDLSNPNDPRPFQFVTLRNLDNGATPTAEITYSDIQFHNQTLYATRITLANIGGTGQVGQADLYAFNMPIAASDYGGDSMGPAYSYPAMSLGAAYADSTGGIESGSWQIASDGGIVYQRITGVNTNSHTVSAHICYGSQIGGCDFTIFQQVSSWPVDALPQVSISGNNTLIAMGGPSVSVVQRNGSHFAKLTPGAWGTPPQWSPDSKSVVATQLVSDQPDSSGVIHYATNVVVYPVGGQSSVVIANAQDFSWA